MLKKLKKWIFGESESLQETARAALVIAADRLALLLEDDDDNGLPDLAERAARYAAQIVAALEIIHGHSAGKGALKINSAMQEILAAARKGALIWNLALPFIEAAVNLLPRKRGRVAEVPDYVGGK